MEKKRADKEKGKAPPKENMVEVMGQLSRREKFKNALGSEARKAKMAVRNEAEKAKTFAKEHPGQAATAALFLPLTWPLYIAGYAVQGAEQMSE